MITCDVNQALNRLIAGNDGVILLKSRNYFFQIVCITRDKFMSKKMKAFIIIIAWFVVFILIPVKNGIKPARDFFAVQGAFVKSVAALRHSAQALAWAEGEGFEESRPKPIGTTSVCRWGV